jgi:hypothetical protein
MHSKVWRYLELEKTLDSPDFLSRLKVFSDLVFQPISHILFWACLFTFPSVLVKFGYSETPSKMKLIFYILSSLQIVYNTFVGWSKMIEYYDLGTFFLVEHIKYAKNPIYYKINSPHPSHQLFRYSAATALTHQTDSLQTSLGSS